MAVFGLREAAEQAGTSKSTIWRAIKAGRLSAARTDDGGFAIDAAELFRVFQPQRPAHHATGQDATPVETPETPAQRAGTDETAIRLAALDAENRGLKELIAEVRQSRDSWQAQAERATLALTDQRRPAPASIFRRFWRWLFGWRGEAVIL